MPSRSARLSSMPSDSWNCWLFVTPVSGSLAAAVFSLARCSVTVASRELKLMAASRISRGPVSSARAAGSPVAAALIAPVRRASGAGTARSTPAAISDTSTNITPTPMPRPMTSALRVALATGVVATTTLSRRPPWTAYE